MAQSRRADSGSKHSLLSGESHQLLVVESYTCLSCMFRAFRLLSSLPKLPSDPKIPCAAGKFSFAHRHLSRLLGDNWLLGDANDTP